MNQRNYMIGFLMLLLGFALSAISQTSVNFQSDAGKVIGTLNSNAQVMIIGTSDSMSKVMVVGWVPSSFAKNVDGLLPIENTTGIFYGKITYKAPSIPGQQGVADIYGVVSNSTKTCYSLIFLELSLWSAKIGRAHV